ncbi:hypothetical protein MESS2_1640042 [Mesorhizobium metallidurans STM 2683]|uniref:Uncharacterized protein n=1 Tax=Mesorhizobium metallidurans STM 2683 TaxID=1297569 RepID=M5ELU4_9HYPH|nr:hypothetical protein MESS2_1640042 [Mesorhizobium metallidurans STM 2683]
MRCIVPVNSEEARYCWDSTPGRISEELGPARGTNPFSMHLAVAALTHSFFWELDHCHPEATIWPTRKPMKFPSLT